MFIFSFVNSVRQARGQDEITQVPSGFDLLGGLEYVLGCEFEGQLMRFASAEEAAAVSAATGLPVGLDRATVALPPALAKAFDQIEVDRARRARRAAV